MTLNLFLSGLLLVATSSATAKPKALEFPTTTLAKLKTQSVSEVFCFAPTTYQLKIACDDLKKANISLNSKTSVEFESKTSMTVKSGAASVKVSRTQDPTIFEVNYKKIDVSEYTNILALQEAIAGTLPKFSKISLFLNSAFAQENSNFGKWGPSRQIATTISLMMISTSDTDICQSASQVAKLCRSYPERTEGSKTVVGIASAVGERNFRAPPAKTATESHARKMSADERKKFDNAIESFNAEINLLSREMSHLQNKKQAALAKCQSVQVDSGRSALDDLNECQGSLKLAQDKMSGVSDEILSTLRGAHEDVGLLLKSDMMISRPVSAPAGGGPGQR